MKFQAKRDFRSLAEIGMILFGLLIIGSGNLPAQDVPEGENSGKINRSEQKYESWQINCAEDGACRMSQSIGQPSSGRLILQAKLFKSNEPTLLLSFPLGILLSPGWRYRIDKSQETILPFEVCDSSGCHVGVKLTPKLISALKRGREMKVSFFDAGRNRVDTAISLSGFSEAWQNLK